MKERLSLRETSEEIWDLCGPQWRSAADRPIELPDGLREVFQEYGHGCAAYETDDLVIHACHASTTDIAGFDRMPAGAQWQLIRMPSAPLIRLELSIYDRPDRPFRFESFLNATRRRASPMFWPVWPTRIGWSSAFSTMSSSIS